jgi:hypothetical protein
MLGEPNRNGQEGVRGLGRLQVDALMTLSVTVVESDHGLCSGNERRLTRTDDGCAGEKPMP